MIDVVLYDWIYDNFNLVDITKDGLIQFYYGSAEGAQGSYGVMLKIEDLERPETLCDFQGDTGRALFQFSFWSGGNTGTNTNAIATLQLAEKFKDQLNKIRGVIGTTNQYRIENNITQSARNIGEQTTSVWGSIIESEIWWTKL